MNKEFRRSELCTACALVREKKKKDTPEISTPSYVEQMRALKKGLMAVNAGKLSVTALT